MWMSSRKHANALNSSYDFIPSPPKRDWLLYVARQKVRHTDLGCAPAVWAPWPRDLCLRIEPSTVVSLCRFSNSSSRSLGHSLLLVKEPYEPTYCHNRHPSYRSAEGLHLALRYRSQPRNPGSNRFKETKRIKTHNFEIRKFSKGRRWPEAIAAGSWAFIRDQQRTDGRGIYRQIHYIDRRYRLLQSKID